MESFFLAETTKYLYLLFDPDNFLNNDGRDGTVIQMLNGECVIDTGSYIFNTEAHPIDSAALRCCHEMPYMELINENFTSSNYLGEIMELNVDDRPIPDIRLHEFSSNVGDLKDFGFKVTEWLETDDDKNELLKFIDEIKAMSGKSERINPLLTNSTDNSTIASAQQQKQHANNNISYDDLILFDQLLAAEVNKTIEKFEDHMNDDHPKTNQTAKIITQTTTTATVTSSSSSSSQTSSQSWDADDFDKESTNVINDGKSRPTKEEIVKPFIQASESTSGNTQRRVFDAQKLLEYIRKSNEAGLHAIPNYEMLTCKSQSFLQRLAVLGEMLT